MVGIDIDAGKIESAKQLYSKLDSGGKVVNFVEKPNYRFIHGDARELKRLVDCEFDVVVARHSDVAEFPDVWDTIFRESLRVIRPEGLFIATSFSDIEHEMLERQVQAVGYRILLSAPNRHALPLSDKRVALDKNVLLATV